MNRFLFISIVSSAMLSCSLTEKDTQRYHIVFDNPEGVTTQSQVFLNDSVIGVVTHTVLFTENEKSIVTIELDRSLMIPVHSVFTLYQRSLLQKPDAIRIDLANQSVFINPGDTIAGTIERIKMNGKPLSKPQLDSFTQKHPQLKNLKQQLDTATKWLQNLK